MTFVDNLCAHVKDMHQRAAARRKDFVRRLEEGDFVKGMDFWSGIRHQLCDDRCETIQHIVEESKLANKFKPLKSGAQKGDMLRLLELSEDWNRRSDAIAAMEVLAELFLGEGRIRQSAQRSLGNLQGVNVFPGVQVLAENSLPVREDEKQWLEELVKSRTINPPYVFMPNDTSDAPRDRHPWDGLVYPPTFTELMAGVGVFAACFVAAGAECRCIIEPDTEARKCAVVNARSPAEIRENLLDCDPADLPWTHALVAGPECQPWSTAGKQRGWEDRRAYTFLRVLHTAAVMQPWWVWIENVAALQSVREGRT